MARTDADAEEDEPDDGPGRPRRYHHGKLCEALVEATRPPIEDKGPLGFTMAEAARDTQRAGLARRSRWTEFSALQPMQ